MLRTTRKTTIAIKTTSKNPTKMCWRFGAAFVGSTWVCGGAGWTLGTVGTSEGTVAPLLPVVPIKGVDDGFIHEYLQFPHVGSIFSRGL